MKRDAPLYGLMAEIASADALLDAVHAARRAGWSREIEAYTPMPVEGLAEALDFHRSRVPLWTLLGGIGGGIGGFFMQWYATVIDLPQNIGGRPDNSWPLYVPVSFELTVLGAAFAAVLAMLIANGLPKLYHPVFNAPDFDLATQERFFLCLRVAETDVGRARQFLEGLQALRVVEVPQ